MRRRSAKTVAGGVCLLAVAVGHRAWAGDEMTAGGGALLLAVSINGHDLAEPVVVFQTPSGLLAEEAAVRSWRLTAPRAAQVVHQGRRYVALAGLPGLDVRVDGAQQVLRIQAPPDAFEGSVLDAEPVRERVVTTVVPALFASYALSAEAGAGARSATAFLETGASGAWGRLTSTQAFSRGGAIASAVRLDTTLTVDDPFRLRRLTVGDALTQGGAWSQPVRFAGLRYGAAFDEQPGLITFPTPAFIGRIALPSTVELYVNDVLRFQGRAQPGPFTITQAPLTTGAGQVSLQVRDALGADHAVTSSYYVSAALLRPGLTDFSYEAGVERRGYGLRSFDYGSPFVAASVRRGVTNGSTIETRVEVGAAAQDVGAGAQFLLSQFAEVSIAAAASHSREGFGGLVRAGFSRISPRWSVTAVYQQATVSFRQVGSGGPYEDAPVQRQLQVSLGLSLGRFGEVGAGLTHLRRVSEPQQRIVSLNYGLRIAGRSFLSVFMLHSRSGRSRADTQVGAAITVPLGARSSAFAQVTAQGSQTEFRTAPPSDDGWGGRVAVQTGVRDVQTADVTVRSQAGEATLQATHDREGVDVRLLVSGSAVLLGGRLKPSRQFNGAFAIVETPGAGGVEILVENRVVARTDRDGVAIVTDLRPYDVNRIGVNATDLPLNDVLSADSLIVSPPGLTGALARFAITRGRPATVLLRDAHGAPLDAGWEAHVDGGPPLRTGYDGELFAPNLHSGSIIEVRREAGVCRAVVPDLSPGARLPHIGPLVCAGLGA